MKSVLWALFSLFCLGFYSLANDSLFVAGVNEMAQGNYKEALIHFEQDIQETPSFSSYYNLGVAAGEIEDWSKARWGFEAALKYDTENKEAQLNAEYAAEQLNQEFMWSHPYSWDDRLFIGFGVNTWLVIAILISVFFGFVIYFLLTVKEEKPVVKKWLLRFSVIATLVLGITVYALLAIQKHYGTQQFVIVKDTQTEFYISPEGVATTGNAPVGERLKVKESLNGWLRVKISDNDFLWVKEDEVYVF